MRLVHLSDLHLGYRQYQRLTPAGINQREADVAHSFRRAVDRVIELRPDLILIAGDVFHTARPTNAAIVHAFTQFVRLKQALPDTEVVMIAGNHDVPRTTETGSIFGLFQQLGVNVAYDRLRVFRFDKLDLAVVAVPDLPGLRPQPPETDVRHNVLLMHADVDDVMPRYQADIDRAAIRLPRRELRADLWSYVALGHYHVHQRVEKNAYYSGSLDYTSLNVWGDLSEEEKAGLPGKGFVEFDVATGRHRFHHMPPAREFLELPQIKARNMSVAEVNEAIKRAVDRVKGGIDDKVVRLVVRDVPRPIARELDHRAIREYKRRALSFVLDTRKPEQAQRDTSGAPARRPSVAEVVREELLAREVPPDLDREQLVGLGMRYLADADAAPVAMAVAAEPEG
jgi:DNA repair protein SbcD/Mre11